MYQYRSEANRFDRDFAFEIMKKSEHSFFFKTKGKKRKSITNYRSFAITNLYIVLQYLVGTEHGFGFREISSAVASGK